MSLELLTTSDTARALGVTPARVRHMIAAGQIVATKLGRDWMIATTEVDRCRRHTRTGGRPWSPARAAAFLADVDAGRRRFADLDTHRAKLRHRPSTDTLSGQWLDLVEAGDPAAERIGRMLRRRYTGPVPLADLAGSVGAAAQIDWTQLRLWADHVRARPDALAASLAEQPPPSGSDRGDNLLAAIAEVEADRAGVDPPAWTRRIAPLAEPWVAQGTRRMIANERRLAPPRFVDRNIWLGAANIWRTP